jgi:hypothetical protein
LTVFTKNKILFAKNGITVYLLWKDVEKKAKKDTVIPEHDTFRWALEEFRVSLFTQHTKPLIPYLPNAWINSGMTTRRIANKINALKQLHYNHRGSYHEYQ